MRTVRSDCYFGLPFDMRFLSMKRHLIKRLGSWLHLVVSFVLIHYMKLPRLSHYSHGVHDIIQWPKLRISSRGE